MSDRIGRDGVVAGRAARRRVAGDDAAGDRVAGRGRHAGFTLVETMIALVLIAVTLTAMAPVLFETARQQRRSRERSQRRGHLMAETNRYLALPFDSLENYAGCRTRDDVEPPHELCIELDTLSARERRVRIVITPSDASTGPDTMVLRRTRPAAPSPF